MSKSTEEKTPAANYSKALDAFAKLKTLYEKQQAFEAIKEYLAEQVEQEILLKNGQLADLQNFKETIK